MAENYKVWLFLGKGDKVVYISPENDAVENTYLAKRQTAGQVMYIGLFSGEVIFGDKERYFGYVKTHKNQNPLKRLLSLRNRNIDFLL